MGGSGDAPARTFPCGPSYACTFGAEYCGVQDPSTYKDTTSYSCQTLPAGCEDCACLCPDEICPWFALTDLCRCRGESSALTVECNGE